jgi:hypothetical protein
MDPAAGPGMDGRFVELVAERLDLARAPRVGPWHHRGHGAAPHVDAEQAVPVGADDHRVHGGTHAFECAVDRLRDRALDRRRRRFDTAVSADAPARPNLGALPQRLQALPVQRRADG